MICLISYSMHCTGALHSLGRVSIWSFQIVEMSSFQCESHFNRFVFSALTILFILFFFSFLSFYFMIWCICLQYKKIFSFEILFHFKYQCLQQSFIFKYHFIRCVFVDGLFTCFIVKLLISFFRYTKCLVFLTGKNGGLIQW